MIRSISDSINHKPPHWKSSKPPESENGVVPSRGKSRDSTSRSSSYSSSSATKQCSSPLVSRTNLSTAAIAPAANERSGSVERRRRDAATPRPKTAESRAKLAPPAAQRVLFASARSLTRSFQGDSSSLEMREMKPAPSPRGTRKKTPERRKPMAPAAVVSVGEVDQLPEQSHRWPKSRQSNSMREKLNGSKGDSIRTLQNSKLGHGVFHGRSSIDYTLDRKAYEIVNLAKLNLVPKKFHVDSPISSPKAVINPKFQLSPISDPVRPVSPRKLYKPVASALLRGTSPSRERNGGVSALSGTLRGTPSILSFAADARRGNLRENQAAEAHFFRLVHNALLQWRFVNARGDAGLSVQEFCSERSLLNAWFTISRLRDSVEAKRTELQHLKQNWKLNFILRGQMSHLEEWATLDEDHCASLLGAIEALRASTLRLPAIDGATANVQSLKDAICSALDMMQKMASSTCLLLTKVGDASALTSELVTLSSKERSTLNQCRDLLSRIAALLVRENSLRMHIVQMQHSPSDQLKYEV